MKSQNLTAGKVLDSIQKSERTFLICWLFSSHSQKIVDIYLKKKIMSASFYSTEKVERKVS